jgi:hypothetical protein
VNITQLLIGASAVVALFALLQFTTPDICCGDFDGYYHIRWSRMLWEGMSKGHFPPEFHSLPLTTLSSKSYADQHLLFHLLLMPFTWFGALPTGAKWAAVVFGSSAIISCYWLLLRYRVHYAAMWLAALPASSSLFLQRMNMTRTQSVSLVFIVAGMFLLFERRYRWLALAAFLYVWTYNLFVVLGVMVLIWVGVEWWAEGRLEIVPIGWTLGGFVAGFVINPYFPRDVRLFWEHVTSKTVMQPGAGSEWYALPSWWLFTSGFVAFGAMVAGYIGFGALLATADRRKLQRPFFLLILASLLLVATARSKRFIEYWPAMAVLFAAFTLHALGEARGSPEVAGARWGKRVRVGSLWVALAGSLVYQGWMAHLEMQSAVKPDQYEAGVEWLRKHVPEGEIVFNVNWDDFPKLFYYDPSRPYVSGLDPMYLADSNPELGSLYQRIAEGRGEEIGASIRKAFGARYVFIGKPVPRTFYLRATMSGEFEKVYEDAQCTIFKVVESD